VNGIYARGGTDQRDRVSIENEGEFSAFNGFEVRKLAS
jgi:hypothetical protein